MLQVKSVVILKANPGILKYGGECGNMWICKIRMCFYIERGSYLGFGNRVGMRKTRKKYCEEKKILKE